MVNSKVISAIIGVIVIAIISVAIGTQSEDAVNSSSSVETSVTDLAVVEKNNPNYVLDEDGNKKYQISVGDSPILGD